MGYAVNFVALLAVLAATSFGLPLLVQGCETLGLQRGVSVAVSLVLASGAVVAWAVRTWLTLVAARERPRPSRGDAAAGGRSGSRIGATSGVLDSGAVRLVDAEEESRAGV